MLESKCGLRDEAAEQLAKLFSSVDLVATSLVAAKRIGAASEHLVQGFGCFRSGNYAGSWSG